MYLSTNFPMRTLPDKGNIRIALHGFMMEINRLQSKGLFRCACRIEVWRRMVVNNVTTSAT